MKREKPLILSVDAGGTNFVFSALQHGKTIGDSIHKPSHADNLDKSLNTIIQGFTELQKQHNTQISAISFAFPGPSDFTHGVIGDLGNLPAYRGGVALGPLLEKTFQVPVYINNDADLFAFGEAMSGSLPLLNQKLRQTGSSKEYKNLVGLTLGTGFGLGVINQGYLLRGDNSIPSEVWLMRNPQFPDSNIEESISIRGIIRSYKTLSGDNFENELTPKAIFDFAQHGNTNQKQAALESFRIFGKNLGEVIASLVSLYDANVCIGGGLSNAWDLFIPAAMEQINSEFITPEGNRFPRSTHEIFQLENESEFLRFAQKDETLIALPGEKDKKHKYIPKPRVGIMKAAMDTSEATMVGAYYYALSQLKA